MAAKYYTSIEQAVDVLLAQLPTHIGLASPLGIGKPNPFINQIYQKIAQNPARKLSIYTALSLNKPEANSDMEARFLTPFVARVYQDYVNLDYVTDLAKGQLPSNIQVSEFFLKSADWLNNAHVQQHYISSNYTHIARDMASKNIQIICQAIALREAEDGTRRYSLSCNPDLSLELLALLAPRRAQGEQIVAVGVINRELPFMAHEAEVDAALFDMIIDDPVGTHTLFSTPNMPINSTDYAIGLHVSRMIEDAGTLQIGIGSLGDALAQALILREQDNVTYQNILTQLHPLQNLSIAPQLQPFQTGLYGCSEMFVNGFWQLIQAGIIRRQVFADKGLQQVLNTLDSLKPSKEMLQKLIAAKVIDWPLREQDVTWLKQYGIFKSNCRWQNGLLFYDDHTVQEDASERVMPPVLVHQGLVDQNWVDESMVDQNPPKQDLNCDELHHQEGFAAQTAAFALPHQPSAKVVPLNLCLGDMLQGGSILHGGFFIGPRDFYADLRNAPEQQRNQIYMSSIGYINHLYAHPRLNPQTDETLKRLQRQKGRFINTAMMVTLSGAIISDALEGGRVLSGVGGQYNLVAQAHELADARSIIMLRSHRMVKGKVVSNIVPEYAHCTVPRHLRDLVVSEYGIADLKGQNDAEVIKALLNISDSRCQPELLAWAQKHGKLPQDYRIPPAHCNNFPARIRQALHAFQTQLPRFPFGHDFTEIELLLMDALQVLKARQKQPLAMLGLLWQGLNMRSDAALFTPYLARMNLSKPHGWREHLLRYVLLGALKHVKVLDLSST